MRAQVPSLPSVLPVIALLLTASPTSAASPPTSASDAYLWQRDGNAAAVDAFAGWSSGRLHVLFADDGFVRADDDVMARLRASHVPVVATVRMSRLDDGLVIAAVKAFAGTNLQGVEVDHDCASFKLAAYATWLQATKKKLAPTKLGITALPAWLDSVDHVAVFDAADDVVLQVHAVRAPALLDVKAAVAAVKQAQTERPSIQIALPAYAVSLKDGTQLHAAIDDVAAVRAVVKRPAWFRFPGNGDDAAWDLVTLRSVDERGGYGAGMALRTTTEKDGARLLHVENTGDVALPFPCVAVDGAAAFDAHAGFVVDACAVCPAAARFVFGHSDVVVGWARPPASGELDAQTVTAAAPVGRRHRCRR